jgi:rhomboid family GlyGly-CTERM serine protease
VLSEPLRLVPFALTQPWSTLPGWLRQRPEMLLFLGLLFAFNFPVLFGNWWGSMMFQSEAVAGGEWWRLVTHPFVHVTWYHLLLDGTAFLTLYHSLLETRLLKRLAYVLAGGAGSLVLSWMVSDNLVQGLCGLSGIAHGLMAVSAVEMISDTSSDRTTRRVGWISFVLVVLKAAFEAVTGRMFLGFLAFGMLGDPVAVSHAGGIVGGLSMMLLLRIIRLPIFPTKPGIPRLA